MRDRVDYIKKLSRWVSPDMHRLVYASTDAGDAKVLARTGTAVDL